MCRVQVYFKVRCESTDSAGDGAHVGDLVITAPVRLNHVGNLASEDNDSLDAYPAKPLALTC